MATKHKKKQKNIHAFALDQDLVAHRHAHQRSGAAGVHADQKARGHGALKGNRQNTRASLRKAHIRDGW